MSRRSQWNQLKDSMFGEASRQKTIQERETIPETACGICQNFLENAYASDGRGSCKKLKFGTNFNINPPVFITSGENGYITFFNKNASNCSYFNKMQLIDKDGTECADPEFRRAQRQMEAYIK